MKKAILWGALMLGATIGGFSQYRFEETIPSTYGNYLYAQDLDSATSQYIATGYISLLGRNSKDILLVKWSDNPGYIWVNRYTGPSTYADIGRHVMKTTDGGYLISGTSNSFTSGGNYDGLTFKTNNNGVVQWAEYFGESYNDYALSSCETANYYYVAGKIGLSSTAYQTNGLIMCFNKSTGALVWGKRYKNYNNAYYQAFNSIIVGYDGYLYVSGTAISSTASSVV